MKRVNAIGERTKYIFENGNGEIAIELGLAKDYSNKSKRPLKQGSVLKIIKLCTEFDTPDGELGKKEYCYPYSDKALGEDIILARASSNTWYNLSKRDIENIHSLP